MKKSVILFALALMLAPVCYGQQSQPIPVDPAVRIGHLDNGLTYYIRHHEEPKGQANFYIAQKVGSILEEEDQQGLAHFLEHMCFNGTKHFPGNGVIKYCESIGVKFGQNLNAYTDVDETVYNIDNVPVGATPSSIDSCLWILHDWADGLLLTDEDIDHERGVIHEEWRTRTNAQLRLVEQLLPMMYPVGENHPCPDGSNRYAHRMPIGQMSVVDNFPYKALRDYYEKWYRTDQQAIVVVGDINVDEIEGKIKTIFSTISKPENPAERYYVQIPDNKEPLICMAKDKEQAHAISFLFSKSDPYPLNMRGDVNYFVTLYAIQAIQKMVNARLKELLQSAEPPFIDARIAYDRFFLAKTKSSVMGTVVSSEEGLTKAVTTLYRELLRAARGGFTESEYERAKAEILADAEQAVKSLDKKKSASFCREYVRHFIDNEPIPGAENELAMLKQITAVVKVEMVSQIMAQLVKQENLVLASMLPDKEGLTYPTKEEMAASFAAVQAEDIAPYEETVSTEPLISELPQLGRIVKSKPFKLGYKQYKLSNGATVYFRQTDFDKGEILMTATSPGGTSLYPETMGASIRTLNHVMTVGGVGKFNVTDLRKQLSGRKVSVTPSVSFFDEGMTCSSTPKDFETMLQLNYLYFTDMRSDNEAFASWKERERASIINREKNPTAVFQDSVRTTVYHGANRIGIPTIADLDVLNYEEVMKMARERFADAADFTFIITGAIDEATLLPLIEQYIASLPAKGKHEKANPKTLYYKKGHQAKTFTREMEVPMVSNVFFYSAPMKFNLQNKYLMALAYNALSVELLEEIREKEGGTYSIGAYGNLDGTPAPRYEAFMEVPYQASPEKYEYLNNRIREILSQFAKEGPSQANLDKGKEFFLKNHRENVRENSYWSGALATLLETGQDMTLNYEAIVNGITREDVRKAFAKLMASGNNSEVIMVGKKE